MSNDKPKVALISFHNAYNYGAAMQAFALQKALHDMGVEAEYINYINEKRKNAYNTTFKAKRALKQKNIILAVRFLIGGVFISTRRKHFDAFYEKHLNKTAKVYTTSTEARALNGMYDKFIAGSDQVWNCRNNGGDLAYLLDFVENPDEKISYASSFGMVDIPPEYVSAYSEALKKIGRISVREVIGSRIVERYTGRNPQVVLDPVFLTGIKTWEIIKQEGSVKNERFIFFYTNRDDQIRDFWSIGFSRKGIRSHILSSTIGIKDFLDPKTSVRVSMKPADFLNEIASAELVVTASFHCVAFSIIFHKQFVVFLTGNRGRDERILNLLHICGLTDRIITSETTVEKIESVINYDEVDRKLQPFLDYSREYLKRAVFSLPDIDRLQFPTGESQFFCNDERCTGCMACVAVCPVDAIAIQKNEEGFLVPLRDTSKCIHCKKCHAACQVYNPLSNNKRIQHYYAVKNIDAIRKKSSSGGMFSALSDEILRRGGVICAAAMDKDFKVRHIFATTASERDQMRKTVYVQSDISEVYEGIKRYLSNNTPVLFVGTACQIAGLYRGLEDMDIRLLHTCDIICHGAASPGIFESFIAYLKKRNDSLEEFNFRDKALGWKHGYTVSAVFGGRKIFNTLEIQSFSKMFSKSLINRRSCANCAYTNYDRVGDITIGDFWGLEKSYPTFADKEGVSLVITNTEKGQALFEACDSLRKIEVKKDETKQNSLVKQALASTNRMHAFKIYNQLGYEALAKTYGECNFSGFLKNCMRKVLGR